MALLGLIVTPKHKDLFGTCEEKLETKGKDATRAQLQIDFRELSLYDSEEPLRSSIAILFQKCSRT